MDTYRNYIYLTICETSLDLFKKRGFSTYGSYCKIMYMNIKNNELGSNDRKDIITITDMLNKIYCMEDKEIAEYIVDYFGEAKHNDYEEYIMMIREAFPNSHI